MKFTKTLIAATAVAFAGSAAMAGGLAPVEVETPPIVIPSEPTGGSIPSGYIVLGVLAALVAVAASESSSGS